MVLNNLFMKTELQQILETKVPHLKLCSVKKKKKEIIIFVLAIVSFIWKFTYVR